MKIKVLKTGVLSTIQDLGRMSYLSEAIPQSGAMDSLSARVANKALGNQDDCATIEFTYGDAAIESKTDLLIAYAGSGSILTVNEETLPMERPLFIPAGNIILINHAVYGARIYLAIAGGWDVPLVMGSKSTYLPAGFGGYLGRVLKKGDLLNNAKQLSDVSLAFLKFLCGDRINYPKWSIAKRKMLPGHLYEIRIVPGREFGWFDAQSILDLLSAEFSVGAKSNRMGYQLGGAKMKRVRQQELLSTAICPGTVQVSGDGGMILLMADCQTTGGYPRIAQVALVDLPLCAQLRPGDTFRFIEISRQEAEDLAIRRERDLARLTRAVELKVEI
ncbi:5-oxoprolinase subunit C family protein [Pedobacter duraquae]|uniref:Antagonist of KipI n=1 Tax=Pedobacter duraquae TaxID=425511 RepID=A0A4R6IE15_9SPHI|nr:biotin-dependent carboxyltransferase family protein [Pedobacter duraquae]TDO20204.1 antagonist of KipI [Pedobacter duraquae]